MNKLKISHHIIKNVLIPIILFIICFFLSSISLLTYKTGFSVLEYKQGNAYSLHPQEGDLYAGQNITGTVTARDNNLGVVGVRLHNFNRGTDATGLAVEEDRIRFRIKEIGTKNWYYEHVYSGGQFHELEIFPFGFVTIKNSKGKSYEFEVTSLDGNSNNKLTLSNASPEVITQYQFSKGKLLTDKNLLLYFLIQKIIFAFSNAAFYLLLFICWLPFLLYMLWISAIGSSIYLPIAVTLQDKLNASRKNKVIKKVSLVFLENFLVVDLILILAIFGDILFISESLHITIIILSMLVIVRVIFFGKKNAVPFRYSLVFLVTIPLLLISNMPNSAEKAAIWIYFLLLLGAIQLFFTTQENP